VTSKKTRIKSIKSKDNKLSNPTNQKQGKNKLGAKRRKIMKHLLLKTVKKIKLIKKAKSQARMRMKCMNSRSITRAAVIADAKNSEAASTAITFQLWKT